MSDLIIDSTLNNKRIAKNTLFLYIRMILVMGVTLFTSRLVLYALGEENYGIYNVVGCIVAMFGFFSSTLTSTCQRYFSYYIGKEDNEGLERIFKLNMTTFLLFAAIVLILAETVGLWFVNEKLNIPNEKMFSMNCVYQCTIVGLFCSVILVPYSALIIAHERMSAFAYISIVEVFLKLILVVVLQYIPSDKLVLYALSVLFTNISIVLYYYYYCHKCFNESKYKFYWDKKEFKDVLSYSGWHLIGALSVMIRNQGVNVLLNTFFNPIVNAGRAIAFQISHAVDSLSNNFFVAVKPQIYKYYAQSNFADLYSLLITSTKVCFYLILIIAVPVIVNTESILAFWLKDVPVYAVLFTQLSLINAIADSINGPAIAAALATTKIKWFEIITGGLMILNLPLSYIVLRLGACPESTVLISIALSVLTIVVRAFILEDLIGLSKNEYLVKTCAPLIIVTFISIITSFLLSSYISNLLIDVVVTTIYSFMVSSLLFYYISLNKSERRMIYEYMKFFKTVVR